MEVYKWINIKKTMNKDKNVYLNLFYHLRTHYNISSNLKFSYILQLHNTLRCKDDCAYNPFLRTYSHIFPKSGFLRRTPRHVKTSGCLFKLQPNDLCKTNFTHRDTHVHFAIMLALRSFYAKITNKY